MLILTRTIQESIMIGDDIVICVVGVCGNKVRLGIRAPLSIPVHRLEIYARIQTEKMKMNNEKESFYSFFKE